MFKIVYTISLFIIANKLFYLAPWAHVRGVFNVLDIGNALIFVGMLYTLFKLKNHKILLNPVSILILLLFLLVGIQASLASIYYLQSIKSSIIAIRHMFYYCSFFIFIFIFQTSEEIYVLLEILSIISVIIVILSLVNYFGPVIFYHPWAEGHAYRSGIKRAFIPGMDLISFSLLWQFSKWNVSQSAGKVRNSTSILLSLFFLGALFFRQTRSRIVAACIVIIGLLSMRRRFKAVIFLVVSVSVAFVIIDARMEKNILTNPFTGAVEDVLEKKGTWDDRIEQLNYDFDEFLRYPVLGNGLAAYRSTRRGFKSQREAALEERAKMDDLGYTHWLKAYGLVGMVWLIVFLFSIISIGLSSIRVEEGDKVIATFGLSYIVYVVISLVTLNHVVFPWRILPLCFVASILVRTGRFQSTNVDLDDKKLNNSIID